MCLLKHSRVNLIPHLLLLSTLSVILPSSDTLPDKWDHSRDSGHVRSNWAFKPPSSHSCHLNMILSYEGWMDGCVISPPLHGPMFEYVPSNPLWKYLGATHETIKRLEEITHTQTPRGDQWSVMNVNNANLWIFPDRRLGFRSSEQEFLHFHSVWSEREGQLLLL